MAEVFGIAAGAVGVVSLSIQLAESLQKVKEFYASVRNAPLQVAELIEEIEIMQDILSDLEMGSQTVASSTNMKRCITVAQKASKGFAAFAEEIRGSINKRRYRAGVRFALSRDEIKHMLDQLERAKSSLLLAYNLYQQATAEDRHITMMQAMLQAVSSSQGAASLTTQTNQETPSKQDCSVRTNGKLRVTQCTSAVGKKLFRMTTPAWLSNTIWQLEMRRSISGLNIFARTYGIVPFHASIFSACVRGDIIEMQRLFDSGLASPYDKTEAGWSLWWTAIQRANIDMLRFLSKHYNAPEQACSHVNFHHVASSLWLQGRLPKSAGAQTLRDDIAWLHDIAVEASHGLYMDVASSSTFQLLDCPSEDVESALFWHGVQSLGFRAPSNPFSEGTLEEMSTRYVPEYHGGQSSLQLLAVAYGQVVTCHLDLMRPRDGPPDAFSEAHKEDFCNRLTFLEKLISIAVSDHTKHHSDHCVTPMSLFMGTCQQMLKHPYSWSLTHNDLRPRILRTRLMFWLKALQGAGVDLVMYGAEESDRLLENSAPDIQSWHFLLSDLSFTFSYGSSPEDWTLEFAFPVEDYVYDFWNMPGLYDKWPVRAIPGGWIDE